VILHDSCRSVLHVLYTASALCLAFSTYMWFMILSLQRQLVVLNMMNGRHLIPCSTMSTCITKGGQFKSFHRLLQRVPIGVPQHAPQSYNRICLTANSTM
jgi:hypothetical protein